MKKYQIGTCGYYGEDENLINGQTIRSKNVTRELKKHYKEKLFSISYHTFRKKPFSNIINYCNLMLQSANIVMFPDENAVKFFIPFSVCLKKIFRCRCYYVVIGGWLPECLKKHKWLIPFMKNMDGLFVQTSNLQNSLNDLGISCVEVFPNFKTYDVSDNKKETEISFEKPYNICFFSRVIGQKGVKELIDIVKDINKTEHIYNLDIYGPVDDNYEKEFNNIVSSLPQYIKYKGFAKPEQAVNILSNYFLQVFPTKFKTEGHPGSILDSYNAGTPVLSARWNSWADIIDEGKTGITFEFEDFEEMKEKMLYIAENPDVINSMRKNCKEKAKDFSPENVIRILVDKIGG